MSIARRHGVKPKRFSSPCSPWLRVRSSQERTRSAFGLSRILPRHRRAVSSGRPEWALSGRAPLAPLGRVQAPWDTREGSDGHQGGDQDRAEGLVQTQGEAEGDEIAEDADRGRDRRLRLSRLLRPRPGFGPALRPGLGRRLGDHRCPRGYPTGLARGQAEQEALDLIAPTRVVPKKPRADAGVGSLKDRRLTGFALG